MQWCLLSTLIPIIRHFSFLNHTMQLVEPVNLKWERYRQWFALAALINPNIHGGEGISTLDQEGKIIADVNYLRNMQRIYSTLLKNSQNICVALSYRKIYIIQRLNNFLMNCFLPLSHFSLMLPVLFLMWRLQKSGVLSLIDTLNELPFLCLKRKLQQKLNQTES